MWDSLQLLRHLGADLRREALVDPDVVDFARLSARTIVEVDGASHSVKGAMERARTRDLFLDSQGFRVKRLSDSEVIGGNAGAFGRIEAALQPYLKTPPLTSPHKGEGNTALPLDLDSQ